MGREARLKGATREERIVNAIASQKAETARIKMEMLHIEALEHNKMFDLFKSAGKVYDPCEHSRPRRRVGIVGGGALASVVMMAAAMGGFSIMDCPPMPRVPRRNW